MEKLKKIVFNNSILWLIFVVLTFLIFYRTLGIYFLSDDWHWLWLAKNTQWSWSILTTNYEGSNLGGSYNPLLLVLFKIFFPLFKLKSFYYHLISLILHATNGFLVYILASKLFKDIKNLKAWAWVAGILFLIWPVQVEAVSWLAAWPHLWATLFYLLTLVTYFSKKKYLAIVFFILALLVKEIAISLPFVILIWEIYHRKKVKDSIVYFTFLILFMVMRYIFTGVLFGYYGSSSLGLKILPWLGNLGGFLVEFFSASYLRTIYYKVWYHYLEFLILALVIFLAIYIYYLVKKKQNWLLATSLSLLVVLGPVSPLGLHRTTMEGERYLYLPMIFFALWLVFLLQKVNMKAVRIILLIVVLASLGIVRYKVSIWQQASLLGRNIVESFSELNIKQGEELVTVALPDNLQGAQVFRNNLQQALQLNYTNYPNILPLPIYLQLDSENRANSRVLDWRQDDQGWFAESIDGGHIVTGITSITVEDIYFELWNYNYQNYTANVIRLITDESIKILSFEKGKLKIIDSHWLII